jgi:hypothetical protein
LDLASGFPHALLGYTTLAIGGLLVLSTDQFLTFLFGPVEPTTIDSSNEAVGKVTGFWNRVFAGDPERAAKARSKLPSRFARGMIVAGSALMLLIGVASIGTAVQMLTSGYIVKFFKNSETIALEKADLQPSIGRWAWIPETETVKPYMFSLRKAGSDLGLRSDQWTYQDGPRLAMVALDQPFPGWHELTRCYQNNGWTLVENGRKYQPAKDKKFDKEWPYIQVELTKPTGEKGFLLFSFFDVNGQPFDAPTDWGAVNKLLIRIRNRLSPAVRARLFNEESFQVQAFIQSPRALTDKERQDAAENYLELREQIRSAFLQRRAKGPSAGTTAVANSEAKQ